jgi:predicted FMN-binding regulatory protein PaiB
MKLQLNIIDGISQEIEIESLESPAKLTLNKADAMVLVLALTLAQDDESHAAFKAEVARFKAKAAEDYEELEAA